MYVVRVFVSVRVRVGRCQAVNLEPGDLLFYESAKCMHGRPRPFKGKYYSSIFIHYLPVR